MKTLTQANAQVRRCRTPSQMFGSQMVVSGVLGSLFQIQFVKMVILLFGKPLAVPQRVSWQPLFDKVFEVWTLLRTVDAHEGWVKILRSGSKHKLPALKRTKWVWRKSGGSISCSFILVSRVTTDVKGHGRDLLRSTAPSRAASAAPF